MGWTESRRSHSIDAIDQTTRQQTEARGTYLVSDKTLLYSMASSDNCTDCVPFPDQQPTYNPVDPSTFVAPRSIASRSVIIEFCNRVSAHIQPASLMLNS